MKNAMIKMVDAYRAALSPIATALGARCRFHPTCSEYARQAIEKFPIPRAAALIASRLIRCNPLCEGGIDEIPARDTR